MGTSPPPNEASLLRWAQNAAWLTLELAWQEGKSGPSGSAGDFAIWTASRGSAWAPPLPPAFDDHAQHCRQCAAGSTKRVGRSTKAGAAARFRPAVINLPPLSPIGTPRNGWGRDARGW